MLISYRWLQRHVDLSGLSAVEVGEKLTLSTAEVEGIERFAPCLDDVVVGLVTEREKHPDADRLSVCTVDTGDGEPLQIVCGAPNVRAGLRVAVARVGTVLPGDFKIKKSKIRGVASFGMICSERELGLGDEHDGIWELPDDAEVGAPVARALDAEDWVIEIDNKSLTHRPDLWGHRGIAGELAAITERPLLPLDVTLPSTGGGEPVPVDVRSAACSRYLALPIDGVSVQRSPDWMRRLLLAAGQRPIDLLVDVSNFVMLDLGQPNHLFDRGRLSTDGIVVRDATPGERMTTLDELERELAPADLLICSGDEPVALAGIMGGAGSAVGEDTSSLVLEVATFAPAVVRRTSARLGLRTDASARFEKHLDPTLPLACAGHLVRLLASIQPDLSLPAPLTDSGDWTDPACTVALRPQRVRDVLGAPVDDDTIAGILERLGFDVDRGGERWAVGVPSARATKDVQLEEDLIEEVGRIYLYGRIEERPLEGELAPPPHAPRRVVTRGIEEHLSGPARFHEAMTHNFQADALLETLGLAELPHVRVRNAIAEGYDRIRRSVVPSLIGVLPENLQHPGEVRLFEIGRGYLPEETDEVRHLPREVHEAAIVWAGPKAAKDQRFDEALLPRMQGVVNDLLRFLERGPIVWDRPAPEELPPWAHAARCARARCATPDGARVALLAELDPEARARLGVEAEVVAASVSVDGLLELPSRVRSHAARTRFPGIKIDVALAVDEAVPAGDLLAAIERSGKGLVAGAEVFDLYQGEQVGAGRKSVAWHVLLQAADRTLTDKDGQKFLGRLEREMGALGGELRRD
jgi:phenylalanyl-tRNA synthetase beta chain